MNKKQFLSSNSSESRGEEERERETYHAWWEHREEMKNLKSRTGKCLDR